MKIGKKLLMVLAVFCCLIGCCGCATALTSDEIPSELQAYFNEENSIININDTESALGFNTELFTIYCNFMKNRNTYDLSIDTSEWTSTMFKNAVSIIVSYTNLTPSQKLYCETLVFGMEQKIIDYRNYQEELSMWFYDDDYVIYDDETGEILLQKPVRPSSCDGYTDDEMEELIKKYNSNYKSYYKSTGSFGDPIN